MVYNYNIPLFTQDIIMIKKTFAELQFEQKQAEQSKTPNSKTEAAMKEARKKTIKHNRAATTKTTDETKPDASYFWPISENTFVPPPPPVPFAYAYTQQVTGKTILIMAKERSSVCDADLSMPLIALYMGPLP